MKKFSVLLLTAALLITLLAPISASAEFTEGPMLDSLTNNVPNTGIMLPSTFVSTQPSYLLTVADWVSRVYFVPYCSTPGVTIYFNGDAVASGSRTATITMTDEPTLATITLISSYTGLSNTYVIYLQRRPSERRTRVSAGYIESLYSNGSTNYIRADLVTVTYTEGTNLSSFTNETYYIYDYACNDNCIFYYGTLSNPVRAVSFSDFAANYRSYGTNLYRIIYIEDEIVAVMPYGSDYLDYNGSLDIDRLFY
ncbi:MAG TPA: cadherin-like beta sandwich domain-containing protein [Candidatus Limiplasma sp.]|nr:cadherin-like beta sandwich domain-containing protein [Candidatus Limiplasma sp.]